MTERFNPPDIFHVESNATTQQEYKKDFDRFHNFYGEPTLFISVAVGLVTILGESIGVFPTVFNKPDLLGFGTMLATFIVSNTLGSLKEGSINKAIRQRIRRTTSKQ